MRDLRRTLKSSASAIALVFLFLCLPCLANADFSGLVVGVLDGDTIDVLHDQHAERIRLNGIDYPEQGQAYGKKAKQAASALVFGREVTVYTHGLDKYGRNIADVLLSDGTNINHQLVKDGWCWWYRKYAPKNRILEDLERGARASGQGLWADPSPIPPWVYRRARRGKSFDLSDPVPFENNIEGAAATPRHQ
jgi:micrococcal nuclease